MIGYILLFTVGTVATLALVSATVRNTLLALIDGVISAFAGATTGTADLLTAWWEWSISNTVGRVWLFTVIAIIAIMTFQALYYNDAIR